MSVDKFELRKAVVNVQRETKTTLRDNNGIRLSDKIDINVDIKKICNLSDGTDDTDIIDARQLRNFQQFIT